MKLTLLISLGLFTIPLGGAAFSHEQPAVGMERLRAPDVDDKVRPGDDFDRYANGKWLAGMIIPADRPGISTVSLASDQVQSDVRAIIETAGGVRASAADRDAIKLGIFFHAAMDADAIAARGGTPIVPQLAAIRTAPDLQALVRLMGSTNRNFFGSPFALSIDVDPGLPTRYGISLHQAGLGLPDRLYYTDARFAAVRDAYRDYIVALLRAESWPDAVDQAREALAFETRIAAVSADRAAARDPVASYNPTTPASLRRGSPGFPWNALLNGAGLGRAERLIVAEPQAVPAIAQIVAATPLPTLKAWLAFSVADNAALYLSPSFGDPYFAFRKKVLLGQPAPAPRWQQAMQIVAGGDIFSPDRADHFGNMGWTVGRLYVAQRFPPEQRAAVEAIAANVQEAMAARLRASDWLSQATKQAALAKVAAYRFKIGFPSSWRSYDDIQIRHDDLTDNVLRLASADWDRELAKLNRPVDRGAWQMTPQTIDAYHGQMLDLVFPAALLAAAYDPRADPATNYGAVATIIGHELTHGFDDWGRHFDATGTLHDWWTPEDAAAFRARARKLAVQFSGFEPLPGKFVNGELTLGENIADLGGLSLALDAYRLSLAGGEAPVIGGMTGDQRVFLGWARYLRGKSRDAALARQLAADPHAPRQYRLNGPVRNMADWYAAFAVLPGQALYLPPDARVRIW